MAPRSFNAFSDRPNLATQVVFKISRHGEEYRGVAWPGQKAESMSQDDKGKKAPTHLEVSESALAQRCLTNAGGAFGIILTQPFRPSIFSDALDRPSLANQRADSCAPDNHAASDACCHGLGLARYSWR
ncbi:hypothetical protein EsH8_VIII_000025 [Colletotrichum jinshuiense]